MLFADYLLGCCAIDLFSGFACRWVGCMGLWFGFEFGGACVGLVVVFVLLIVWVWLDVWYLVVICGGDCGC